MATSGTYYLDAGSLADATAVWTDINLTTKAPDQWYSNGAIARQQVSGVLGAAQACACNIAQNILVRNLRVQNLRGSTITLNTANVGVDTFNGSENAIVTAGSSAIANNATLTLLEPNIRVTSNLLVNGDFLYFNLEFAGDLRGASFDWDLQNNTYPIAGAVLQGNVSEFYNGSATIFNVGFEVIAAVPNNFDGYFSGRLRIGFP